MKPLPPEKEPPEKLIRSENLFPVVGIGASAGGLDAFKKLLKAIPADSGMAYVLVQHLDPSHESMLPEILKKVTDIPVLEITDDLKVEPNHIYVIPSNKMMLATDGVLQLAPRPAKSKTERNLPIDLFFSSLAEVHQAHAIGVVLSGTASDGTLGLKAIKEHGGITFAQDEASAAYEGMPNSAAQAGVVDFILPPDKIPGKLLEVLSFIHAREGVDQTLPLEDEEVFRQINSVLRIRKGTDFTYYKQTTIRRRILRRMAISKQEEPVHYLKYLRENKSEQDILYQDLLISVTSFFRDFKIFDYLSKNIIPLILKNKAPEEPIRIWVAGCSTGEEAYSLAICFKEFLDEHSPTRSQARVQIFATDLSEPAIKKARAGIYSQIDVMGISPQRLHEFFTKTTNGYLVKKQIRDTCIFANHNFLKDPPFGKLDLVSCRNVLIYLEPYLQKKALTTFHYSLNLKGFLLLGKSETTSGVPDLFSLTAKTEKIYTRKDAGSRFMQVVSPQAEQTLSHSEDPPRTQNMRSDFQKTADDIMLRNYTPSGVVVNEDLDIVQFRGSTSNYLEQQSGRPSHNLLVMAKHGLVFELRSLLHKVKKEKVQIRKDNIPISVNGVLRNIAIEAIPLPDPLEPHYLILFHDNTTGNQTLAVSPKKRKASAKSANDPKEVRLQQLEQDLAQTREDMRSITEDQEAANEELQSANEELLSGSEELQSLNEELETSKEELQSTNEELTVVNQEIIGLNEQISAARNYAEAIVANIREPLIVLDKYLRVKTANKAFYDAFRVKERETEGVLLYDLGNKQWDIPELRDLLERILPEKSIFNDFEVTHTFPHIGELIILLNAREVINKSNAEKFILLSIEDITERKKAQRKVEESEHRYHNMIYSSPSLIAIFKGPAMIIEIANDAVLESWGKDKSVIGKSLFTILPEIIAQGIDQLLITVYQTGESFQAYEMPVTYLRNGKPEVVYYTFVYQPQRAFNGEIEGVALIGNEVTPQAVLHKKIRESEETFRQLAELMPEKIWNADIHGNIFYVNQHWYSYTGLAVETIYQSGWEKVVDPDKIKKIIKNYHHAIRTETDFNMEMQILHTSGVYKWHLCRASAVRDDAGIIVKWIGVATEIQEQVEQREALEQAVLESTADLREANEELLRMNKELEAFTYVSSHDLQEPLRKIQTFASRIVEKEKVNLSDKGQQYFHLMEAAAKRMQTLIEDLLTFSRLSKQERTFAYTDLSLIIATVVEELKEDIDEKHALVELPGPCHANVIPFQFHQLICNILSNSLKFSKPHQPPHIIIRATMLSLSSLNGVALPEETPFCHITVQDNGIGFKKEYREKIFEVFQKLHDRETYSGAGIGLAIVKKIVDNHNGFISAIGRPNKGTTVEIYLPAEH